MDVRFIVCETYIVERLKFKHEMSSESGTYEYYILLAFDMENIFSR